MAGVVHPVLDQAAAERARLVNTARAALLRSAGAVTVDMIAGATGRSAEATRQWLRRHRQAGHLVTVTRDGNVFVPTFQLDDAFELDEVVSDIVACLVERHMSGWAVWDWFATPNTWLDGATPAAALDAGGMAAVHRAVAGLFQE